MAKKLLGLVLTQYDKDTFNESIWRTSFDGIEQHVDNCHSGNDYIEQRSDTSLFNPAMQLEDNPQPPFLFLITPHWSDE